MREANERYKAIKKYLGITDTDVARMFGYKDANVFRNSARKDQIVRGIIELFDLICE